jgi:hypothetical protein
MALDLPVVLNRHANGVLVGDPKECNLTADRVKRTDLDGVTGFNGDRPQFSGLELDPPIAAGSDNERKDSEDSEEAQAPLIFHISSSVCW